MMKKHCLILLLILFKANIFYSQKYELGKVTMEELQEKKHPIDTAAVAAILFNVGEVRFEYYEDSGFNMITVVRTKIKIYKKEGYDFANFSRKYYIGGNSNENLNFSKAVTYNIVDGKIEKTKLKSDGEFDEKINKFWNRKKIALPNVKEGSIIEFEYTLKSPSIGTIDEWQFQTNVPVNYSEFATYVPEYYVYNPISKGHVFPVVNKEDKLKTIVFTTKDRNTGTTTTFSQEKLEYKETKTVYSAKDVPALKDEKYVNNIKNYTSSIGHELSVIKYPNQPFKSFSTDWETVTKTIYQNEKFGDELAKTGYFEDDLKIVLKDVSSYTEKIAIIFNFVKSKIKWNEFNSYYCDDGVRKAYKDQSGNSAEINLILTAMLRYAGVEANPVLVSTRSNGISFFPNRTAYNYVIAAVEIDNGLILLDATDKNALPNILPARDLNWMGRIIR